MALPAVTPVCDCCTTGNHTQKYIWENLRITTLKSAVGGTPDSIYRKYLSIYQYFCAGTTEVNSKLFSIYEWMYFIISL